MALATSVGPEKQTVHTKGAPNGFEINFNPDQGNTLGAKLASQSPAQLALLNWLNPWLVTQVGRLVRRRWPKGGWEQRLKCRNRVSVSVSPGYLSSYLLPSWIKAKSNVQSSREDTLDRTDRVWSVHREKLIKFQDCLGKETEQKANSQRNKNWYNINSKGYKIKKM